MTGGLDIHAMTRGEFDTAIDWAAAEGWDPGLDDGDAFHGADPGGFIGTWLAGRLIACISAVRYGGDFGFIGFYICHSDYRGQGYGWQTWQAGMAQLGARTIGLDGVIDQQANYRKSGFRLAHRNLRYAGAVACEAPADARLRPIDEALVEAVVAYDAPFFAAPRAGFMRAWATPGATRAGVALIEDGGVTGFAVGRRCREAFKIGPLFADSAAAADLLFRALAGRSNGAPVYLDVPEPNGAARALAERYAMTPVFETARMYRGAAPDLALARTWGITTFELG